MALKDLIKPKKSQHTHQLCEIIDTYNALSLASDDSAHIKRLFYLQKINDLLRKNMHHPDYIEWQLQLGDTGLETHLQRYGIHRDASILLMTIEFAQAVMKHAPPQQTNKQNISFFNAQAHLTHLFKPNSEYNALDYIHTNSAIMAVYTSAPFQPRSATVVIN